MKSAFFQTDKNNNSTSKGISLTKKVIGGTIILSSIAGVGYLIYKYFSSPTHKLTEEMLVSIEELKTILEDKDNHIDVEIAIRVLALINKLVEENLSKEHPKINTIRRNLIEKPNEYNQKCSEYFNLKEEAYNTATNLILNQFNIDIEDIQAIMKDITPHEVEKKMYLTSRPHFESNIPDRKTVKEGFIYFGNKFVDEMSALNTTFIKTREDMNNNNNDLCIFKMLVLKMKIDDSLYLKYGVTENQIRFLIHDYSLLDDYEIKEINDKICVYDEILYL